MGWMDGWREGGMDGWIIISVDGRTDREIDRQADTWSASQEAEPNPRPKASHEKGAQPRYA